MSRLTCLPILNRSKRHTLLPLSKSKFLTSPKPTPRTLSLSQKATLALLDSRHRCHYTGQLRPSRWFQWSTVDFQSLQFTNGTWLLLPRSSIFLPNFSPHKVDLVKYAATISTECQQKQMFSGMASGYGMYSDDRFIGWASAGLRISDTKGIM